jgi:hypothetical protein
MLKRHGVSRWVLVGVVSLWIGGIVFAQTGSISGVVRDERGEVISQASVRVRNVDTGEVRMGVTDEGGRYSFPSLAPGVYEIVVEAPGFRRFVQAGVRVTVGGSAVVDVVLKVGEIVEQVVVTGEAPVVETTRIDISRVVEEREIGALPILGRNFVDFVKLSSQVAVARGDLTGGAFQEPTVAVGSAAVPRLTFGGQNERLTLVQIDGVDNSQTITGLPRATPSQEAVREFRVVNSTYGAEYGRFLAGMVNIVTRSGTEEVHGGGYYYGMNDALNARSVLQPKGVSKALRQHQFGAVGGGPLVRGRVFGFGNYEGQRRAEANLFSRVILENVEALNRVRRSLGLTPETTSLLKVNNYDQFLVKVEPSFTEKHRGSFRYNFLDSETRNFLGGGGRASPASSTRRNAFVRDQAFVVGVTSVVSATTVNEGRFQWGRRRFEFPSVLHEPALEIPNLIIMGKSTSDVDFYRETLVQGVEQVTLTRGEHELKFGMNVNHYRDAVRWELFFPARILFPGLGAFLGLPPFERPTPVLFQWPMAVGVGRHPGIPWRERAVPTAWEELIRKEFQWEHWGVFWQDRWRVTSNLTFSYGIRYDFDTLPKEFADRDYDNVQPRVGLSYGFQGGRGVLRAGFGIFHDVKRIPTHWIMADQVLGWGVPTPLWELGPFNRRTGFVAFRSLVGPAAAAPAMVAFLQRGELPGEDQGVIWTHPPQRDLRTPYSEQASLELEYELSPGLSVSASYLFVHGLKIPSIHSNLNAFRTGATPDGRPLFRGRRDPRFLSVLPPRNDDRHLYHGGTFSIKRRFRSHFSFQVNYTVSKTISLYDPMGWGLDIAQPAINPENERLERSLSNQHVGQRLVATFLGEGPRERLRGVLRDFRLGVILTAEGPRYSTVYAGVDANGDGNPNNDRPGRLGKNTFRGDRFVDVGVRISRRVAPFGERGSAEVLMEFFNLLNTVNIKSFNTVWGSDDLNIPPPAILAFGSPREVFNPRYVQFAVKISF